MDGRFKGLSLLDPAISDRELLHLKDASITGFASRKTDEVARPLRTRKALSDFLLWTAPDETIRKAILADNPAKLYGWPKAGNI